MYLLFHVWKGNPKSGHHKTIVLQIALPEFCLTFTVKGIHFAINYKLSNIFEY